MDPRDTLHSYKVQENFSGLYSKKYFDVLPVKDWNLSNFHSVHCPLKNKDNAVKTFRHDLKQIANSKDIPQFVCDYAKGLLAKLNKKAKDKANIEIYSHNGDIVNSIVGRSIGPDTCVTINSQGDIPAKRLRIIVPEDSQSNHLDLVDLSETAHKPNWKVKDILVAQKFRQYQEKALEEAKEHGLYMESHLQKILALSHILLLKPSQNDAEAVDIYGSDNLKEIQNAFTNQFFKASEIRLSSEVQSMLLSLTIDLKDGVKTRREATQKIHRMQVGADNFTYRILSLVANCIAKLRCHPFNETIGEMELITSILDPVLSPMLHDPDNDMIFKWTNTQVIETEVVNGSRPDSNFILYKESSGFCSLGFGEVKSEKHATDTALLAIDLTRIAVFSKHAIDKSNVNCVLGFKLLVSAWSIDLQQTGTNTHIC
ncbi:hypothetical protein CLU79DRAFT_800452 [Phycomyces nitens]|nr:hypothetical protein CLU79DRAFT_800452 [Phycomyces nitens]